MKHINLVGAQLEIEKIILAIEPQLVELPNGATIMARVVPERLETLVDAHLVISEELGKIQARAKMRTSIPRLSSEVIPRWGSSQRWSDPKYRR